uniref:Putative vesicle transport through interaction with t-snares protein 1b n=1 Tax=Phlebotomus kandelakii TaxID=1109342 RepID=A0A6B2EL01_9DIPT
MANYEWEDHNRRTVLEGRAALERTSASLARSNQIAIETEQIGTEIVSDLGEQRESLLRSQRGLQNANDGLSKSRTILRGMQRNVLYNKLTLILIIVLEVFILGGLVFIKFL